MSNLKLHDRVYNIDGFYKGLYGEVIGSRINIEDNTDEYLVHLDNVQYDKYIGFWISANDLEYAEFCIGDRVLILKSHPNFVGHYFDGCEGIITNIDTTHKMATIVGLRPSGVEFQVEAYWKDINLIEKFKDKLEELNKPFQIGDRVYSTHFKEFGTIRTINFAGCPNKVLVTLDGYHSKEADFVCSYDLLVREKDVVKEEPQPQPDTKFKMGDYVYSDFQEAFGYVQDIKYVTITNGICYFSYLIRFGKKNDVWVNERNLHDNISSIKKPTLYEFKTGKEVVTEYKDADGSIWRHYEPLGEPK